MPDARETKVARLLTDELSAEDRALLAGEVHADAEAAALEAQMRETLGALQGWAESEDRRPRATAPLRLARPAVRWRVVAAAAVVILALAGATMHLLRQPQIQEATNRPKVDRPSAPADRTFTELDWIAALPPAEPPPAGGAIRFEEPGKGGMGGASIGGPDGGSEGGSGSIGAPGGGGKQGGLPDGGTPPIAEAPAEALPPNPALEGFAKQFAFAFCIPETLPGGYEFLEGKPVNPRAVQLIYRRGQGRMIVYLAPASGADTLVREARIGGRVLRCIRQHGLCAGFSGPMPDSEITQHMQAFTRKETEK